MLFLSVFCFPAQQRQVVGAVLEVQDSGEWVFHGGGGGIRHGGCGDTTAAAQRCIMTWALVHVALHDEGSIVTAETVLDTHHAGGHVGNHVRNVERAHAAGTGLEERLAVFTMNTQTASGLVSPLLFPLGKLDGMQKEETCGEVLNEGLQGMIEGGNRVLQGLVAVGPHVAVFEGQCLVDAFSGSIRYDGDFAGGQHHGSWYGHFHKQVLRCKCTTIGAEILHAICRDQENITVSCTQRVIQLQLGGQFLSPPQLQAEEFPASAVLPYMLVNIRGERLCADAVVAEPLAGVFIGRQYILYLHAWYELPVLYGIINTVPSIPALLELNDSGQHAAILIQLQGIPQVLLVDDGVEQHVVRHNEVVGESLVFQVGVCLADIGLELE